MHQKNKYLVLAFWKMVFLQWFGAMEKEEWKKLKVIKVELKVAVGGHARNYPIMVYYMSMAGKYVHKMQWKVFGWQKRQCRYSEVRLKSSLLGHYGAGHDFTCFLSTIPLSISLCYHNDLQGIDDREALPNFITIDYWIYQLNLLFMYLVHSFLLANCLFMLVVSNLSEFQSNIACPVLYFIYFIPALSKAQCNSRAFWYE